MAGTEPVTHIKAVGTPDTLEYPLALKLLAVPRSPTSVQDDPSYFYVLAERVGVPPPAIIADVLIPPCAPSVLPVFIESPALHDVPS